jgi:TonB-dependent SusC/RagA subfamily outer membrane receptor
MKVNLPFTRSLYFAFLALFLLCWNSAVIAQTSSVQVKGSITSPDGGGLPGVSVSIKGTQTATSSDAQGNYSILVPRNSTLVFSQIGSEPQEVVVVSNSDGVRVINITMKETNTTLNEVVVVGYGTQSKAKVSGAISQVSGDDLVNRPVPNVTGALQGVSPGLTVVRGSGKPGSEGYGIRIRGFTSANDASALVLVDGIEQDMNLINPDDVETVTVLKDASASAIYGARAAAGVLLITTKKGKPGATKIGFSNY